MTTQNWSLGTAITRKRGTPVKRKENVSITFLQIEIISKKLSLYTVGIVFCYLPKWFSRKGMKKTIHPRARPGIT